MNVQSASSGTRTMNAAVQSTVILDAIAQNLYLVKKKMKRRVNKWELGDTEY